jgi:hypothetical protein
VCHLGAYPIWIQNLIYHGFLERSAYYGNPHAKTLRGAEDSADLPNLWNFNLILKKVAHVASDFVGFHAQKWKAIFF